MPDSSATNFEDVDYELMGNLAFCIPMGVILVFTFSALRKPFLRFYATNSVIFPFKNKNVLPTALKSKLQWFQELMKIPETEALRIAGLDVFGMLQAFKMMFLLAGALAVPAVLILMPYYYWHADTSGGPFKFSNYNIDRVYSASVWIPMLVALLATLICLHFIRVFLAGFVRTRQHFLYQPSFGAAFRLLREATEGLGDLQAAREYFDCSSRAVLITSIPQGLSQERLRGILERASGGSVEKLISVQKEAVEGLERAVEERQEAIEELEEQLQEFNARLKQEQGVADREESRIPIQERKALLLKLLTCGKEPKLQEAYDKCLKLDREAREALNAFNSIESQIDESNTVDTNPFLEQAESLLLTADAQLHQKQVKGLQSFAGGSMLAVMNSERAARTLSQVLLSGNPFALQTHSAPPPNDLIWRNAALSPAERRSRRQMGRFYYALLHLAYAPISVFITNLADLKKLARSIPQLAPFANTHPIARVTIQGIICPFVLIYLMNFMVPIITAISRSEGYISETEVQLHVLDRYSTFILIQTAIIGVIFSSFLEAYEVFLIERIPGVINLARKLYPAKAHFFANVLLQSCFIDLCLELLRPGILIYAGFFDRARLAAPEAVHENVRKEVRSWRPLGFEFGEIVSEAIIFPFHIFMSYYLLNPLVIFPALAYFGAAFTVYKYNALYVYSAEWESGGRMWLKIAKQMTVGVVLMQFFGSVQFLFMSSRPVVPFVLMVALMSGTIVYVRKLLAQVRRYEKFTSGFKGESQAKKSALMAQKQFELLKTFPPVDTFAIVNARLLENSQDQLEPSELPEKRLYETVPFDLSPEGKCFDAFDPDALVDIAYAKRAYSNPFSLEYTQVIYLPSKLASRLKIYFE